jgi:2-polyprenyl-3-methyl-5-hydroxy-6-metoxy-1,4-benzoquinol methylase
MAASKLKRIGEPQYQEVIEAIRRRGPERLGLMTSWAWYDDPKRLTFTLSRYKFVAKMLENMDSVLEVGCGDGFGARVVAQAVRRLTAVDFDPEFIESAKSGAEGRQAIGFRVHDILKSPVPGRFDAIYSLDVLEHVSARQEKKFLKNLAASLVTHGVCIIGMPSLESQAFASKFSKMGHVNCKTQPALRALMHKYFANVFMFSMNDEVVHTGYAKMSHYNIALCCSPVRPR